MASDTLNEGSTLVKASTVKEGVQKVSTVNAHDHYLVQDTFEERMSEWSNRDGDVGGEVSLALLPQLGLDFHKNEAFYIFNPLIFRT